MDARDAAEGLAYNFAATIRGDLTSEENIDKLLEMVLKSRVQRKAKDIVRSGINYLFFIAVVLQTSPDIIGATDANLTTPSGLYEAIMSSSFGNVIGMSIVFIVLLSSFIFWHATKFHKCMKAVTDEAVENAYEQTNKYPAFDGLLELVFPYRFKGYMWAFPYFVLAICSYILLLGLMLYLDEQENMTQVTSGALGASALQLLAVATDFSEYWVHTRNQENPGRTLDSDTDTDNEVI